MENFRNIEFVKNPVLTNITSEEYIVYKRGYVEKKFFCIYIENRKRDFLRLILDFLKYKQRVGSTGSNY